MQRQEKVCSICGGGFSEHLQVKEEMFGLDEYFDYGLCGECGCLQCASPPGDLSKYYPSDYYSFTPARATKSLKQARRGLKRRLVLTHPEILSPLFKLWLSSFPMFWIYRQLGVKLSDRLLDVGAGGGAHVAELRSAGARNALGTDPFVAQDVYENDLLLVRKGNLADIQGTFDLITFHHSLEHAIDQVGMLNQARNLLAENGRILVRIPTVSSEAFDTYREKWFQLDAPRHLFLHSHQSLRLVAEKAGLRVDDLFCDSGELQFIASEQYRQGISLFDSRSYTVNKQNSVFRKAQIREFREKTRRVNGELRGDQICAVLRPA